MRIPVKRASIIPTSLNYVGVCKDVISVCCSWEVKTLKEGGSGLMEIMEKSQYRGICWEEAKRSARFTNENVSWTVFVERTCRELSPIRSSNM